MLASQIPAKVPLPFANSGTKNAIPTASQIGITPGAASLTDGFPPLTFTPLASGGVPPSGADFNGILNMITAVQQWQSAGGIFKYDAAFSTLIGGYPKGSILMSTSSDTTWLNLADNNTTNPDAADGSAANWASLDAYGIAAIAGLTNANVTLTPAQFGKPIITLSGTLTGNVQVIFPVTLQQWRIVNNTTGAFAVTCKTAVGTGAAVTQGASQLFYGDGTNLVPMPADARYAKLAGLATQLFSVANGTGANHAVALGQFIFGNAVNGSMKIPFVGGTFILQWGVAVAIPSGPFSVTFPIAMTTCLYTSHIGAANNAAGNSNPIVTAKSGTGFSAVNNNGVTTDFNWLSIGYV